MKDQAQLGTGAWTSEESEACLFSQISGPFMEAQGSDCNHRSLGFC